MNVFCNTIVFVRSMEASRKFYEGQLGLNVETDYTVMVIYENHFAIHDGARLMKTIYKKPFACFARKYGRKNIDIYFETDDIDRMQQILIDGKARFIHRIEEQSWGQRVMRFYDPDRHVVEIGEPLHLEYLKGKKRNG